jgi:uncharacterized protein YecT (DUF1311 family)
VGNCTSLTGDFGFGHILDELLGHSIRLRDLHKNARWQTSGLQFHHLHLLFDGRYKEQLRLVDVPVDRIRMLGGAGRVFARDLRKRRVLSMMAITLLSFGAMGQDFDCGGGSHRDEMVFHGKRFKGLDDELNRVYKLALTAMPAKDDQDIRKGREQLRKSQRAWLVYVREECDLEGGLQGGSNSWVSTLTRYRPSFRVGFGGPFLSAARARTLGHSTFHYGS